MFLICVDTLYQDSDSLYYSHCNKKRDVCRSPGTWCKSSTMKLTVEQSTQLKKQK